MHILDAFLDHEFTFFDLLVNGFQLGFQCGEVVGCEQADGFEHSGVGDVAQHVEFGQMQIHLAVAPYREAFYFFRSDSIFLLPEFQDAGL